MTGTAVWQDCYCATLVSVHTTRALLSQWAHKFYCSENTFIIFLCKQHAARRLPWKKGASCVFSVAVVSLQCSHTPEALLPMEGQLSRIWCHGSFISEHSQFHWVFRSSNQLVCIIKPKFALCPLAGQPRTACRVIRLQKLAQLIPEGLPHWHC